MPAHAGFAVAIGLGEQLLNDALLLSYHSGQAQHWLVGPLPDDPPGAYASFFLSPPTLRCRSSDPRHVEMTLEGWGGLQITWAASTESRDIRWKMTVRAYPRFRLLGTNLDLLPRPEDIEVTQWTFSTLSGGSFTPAADTYLRGGAFRDRLKAAVVLALDNGLLALPSIDVSFLGPIGDDATSESRIRVEDGVVLVGIDIDRNGVRTSGQDGLLTDFTRGYDIATALNPVAVPVSLRESESVVRDEVASQGATLDEFSVGVEEGRFRVRGKASRSEGSASFNLGVAPVNVAYRPGAQFPAHPKTIFVKAKSWRVLGFQAVDVHVSINRADWVTLVEVLSVFVTAHVGPLFIESMIKGIARQIAYGIETAEIGTTIPRVRRIPGKAKGDPTVRIEIGDFEIHEDVVFTGLRVRPEPKPPMLIGPTTLPEVYRNSPIRYDVRLPLDVLTDDPKLRIRWTVNDLSTGAILVNSDGPARDRTTCTFTPGALAPGAATFGVQCRAYRALGPDVQEVYNDGFRLDIRNATVPATYVRWHYAAKTPQLKFLEGPQAWDWTGEVVIPRRSAIHKADDPCQFADDSSKYEGHREEMSTLPFAPIDVVKRRGLLCDYCFFGGPSKELAAL